MPQPIIILIPPSESKKPGGRGKPLEISSPDVKAMYDRLTAYRGNQAQLYGVKGKALDAAVAANKGLPNSPTMAAIERYTGVVYNGIAFAGLPAGAQAFFNTHVRIVSAVFGLLRPGDPIPDYKLKIEKLDAAKHWQPRIALQLKGNFVIDLLPRSHQKAVAYDSGIKVDFLVCKNSKPTPAGHMGKLIKGKFIRWLCLEWGGDVKDFSLFSADGFKFDGRNFIKKQ